MPQQDKKTSENTEESPKTWGNRAKAAGNIALGFLEVPIGVGIMAATAVLTAVGTYCTLGAFPFVAGELIEAGLSGGASLVSNGYQRVTNPYNNTKNDNSASQTTAVSSSQEEEEQRKKSRENHIQAQSQEKSSNKTLLAAPPPQEPQLYKPQSVRGSTNSQIYSITDKIAKAKDYKEAAATYQSEFRTNLQTRPFDTLSNNLDEEGNRVITFVDPAKKGKDRENPENHVRYIINTAGELKIESGKNVSCILPPQERKPDGFEMVKIQDGKASYIAEKGVGQSTTSLSIENKIITKQELLSNALIAKKVERQQNQQKIHSTTHSQGHHATTNPRNSTPDKRGAKSRGGNELA